MSYGRQSQAGAYKKLDVETQTLAASPEKIILLLLEGAESNIRKAVIYVEQGDVQGKGQVISKALDIINQGLLSALDFEIGGEVAENMAACYDYVCRQLIEANRTNNIENLNEALKVLGRITDAWRQITSA